MECAVNLELLTEAAARAGTEKVRAGTEKA
eukprot:SAG11_NODE_27560_length_331_cov_0.887931_1_plen_29_part_10